MGLNDTVSAERIHIGFFGLRNAGKSSVVNAVTGQKLSLVSDVKGTTTDPVQKAMELLPLGPVVIIDTPGIDDTGTLGEMRAERARQTLTHTDIAILVTDANNPLTDTEKELAGVFNEKNIPYITVYNKSDLLENVPNPGKNEIYVSAKNNTNIYELKELIGSLSGKSKEQKPLLGDLINKNDIAVLVTPIDSAAPKGRMILPQQNAIRDVLDNSCINIVVKESELEYALSIMNKKPKIVVTDSQAFEKVSKIVPEDIPLTSFSIVFARYKGILKEAVKGASMLNKLNDGDKILISEGCTHHRQCEDIGTVKLPKWITAFSGKKLEFEFTSGREFPDDVSSYALVIHCGGCMLNEREMISRMQTCVNEDTPITNYGTAIAFMNNILKRTLAPFGDEYTSLLD
ncbi:MAG: [FeFe] hydrogenase H-cluster maturation GTPase HydF [Oscillospiraceae bacterium]|nr:[FeFe] hydrogenase H-cluster maturation GTPase HydF [Bacillota bacterium]MDY3937128.1 [FeFe] hydrogenase H-cluster maturation GTPase HydF [Oscillospiraceae bacterium]